jgi:16S rRNA (cytosine967-C5)-methyltransferase
MDATEASAALDTTFERVLVDAPCTGLGTLARRPDVRWRKKHEDIVGLVELQGRLLAEAAKRVEPHGLLVYSTCTISQRENAGVVGAFLEQAPGFGVEASRLKGCEVMPSLQLFPDTDRCDGIFMAVMRRLH